MAQKRMFSQQIIDSDAFLEMPLSAQALYFHLSMRADDDGFVNNPVKIGRIINASSDDLKILLAKNFIISFQNGVIVIKHWRINNYLRKDRYTETVYLDEKAQLDVKENGSYTLLGIPNDNQMTTVGIHSIEKNREEKNSIEKIKEETVAKRSLSFVKPTREEIFNYCKERKNKVDPSQFYDFYEAKGWFVGKNKMKDWKAAVRTWEKREFSNKKINSRPDVKPEWLDEYIQEQGGN